MILYIDTSDVEKAIVALGKDGKLMAEKQFKAKYRQAEKLLPAIDLLLSKVHRTLDLSRVIKGVVVVNGPGPFTALRIGVATANALSYSLNIPIVSLCKDEFSNIIGMIEVGEKKLKKAKKRAIVEPFYGKEPNITISQPSAISRKLSVSY